MFLQLIRALPGERLFCHRRLRKLPSANLTPAPRCQDHTPSPSASGAFVKGAIRVHRIPPRADDVAQRPSEWDGMANHTPDLHFGKTETFCQRDWTRDNQETTGCEVICPSGSHTSCAGELAPASHA